MDIPEMLDAEVMRDYVRRSPESWLRPPHPDSAHSFLQLSPAPQNKKHN